MQAALLETLNRDVSEVLRDVDLDGDLLEISKMTTKGKISLPMLRANSTHPGSLIHPTRTVYVISDEGRPSTDLSWLTEPSRILTPDDFLLARKSDMRAFLSEMQNRVLSEKWMIFNESLTNGWFSILALSFCGLGIASLLGVALMGLGSLMIPLAATSGGGISGLWMLRKSRKKLDEFQEMISLESIKTNKIGDGYRINQSVVINKDKLDLQRNLGFVISPLMASVAGSIGIGDYEDAVTISGLVLDECVRFSQTEMSSIGDEGLSKFLGLFKSLGLELDDAELSLCYVGLSNHIASPLNDDEILKYATTLTNTLYNSGVLKPSVKDRIDDLMNARAMKENLRFLDDVICEHPESDSESEESTDDWMLEELEKSDSSDVEHEVPEIEATTFVEGAIEYDEAESKGVAEQLDELSDLVRARDYSEPTAQDVINLASKTGTTKSTKMPNAEDAVEDDLAE